VANSLDSQPGAINTGPSDSHLKNALNAKLGAAAVPRLAILPDILTRGGAILPPEHPDYPALFALVVREFTERFLAGDISVARYFTGPPVELPLSVRHLYEPPALQTSSPEEENIKEAKELQQATAPEPDQDIVTETGKISPPEIAEAGSVLQSQPPAPFADLRTEEIPGDPPAPATPHDLSHTATQTPEHLVQPRPANPLLFPPNKRPRTGKIAKLPNELRHLVCQQLYDEVPFSQILNFLGEEGATRITKQNITSWKAGGYRDWLAQEEERLRKEARLNHITRTIRSKGSLDDVALSLALNQLFETLDAFEVKLLKRRLSKNPQMYPVVVQALLSLVKARQSFSTPPLTNLPDKPSPGDPDFILPEAERGISEETLKKITDAIRLY
jgi:hypothetical protein